MADALLTLNAGSSSIKFALYPVADPLPAIPDVVGQIEGIGGKAQANLAVRNHDGGVMDEHALDLGSVAEGQHHEALVQLIDWIEGHAADWRVRAVGHRVVHGGPDFAAPALIDDVRLQQLRQWIPLAPLHQPHNVAGIEAMHARLPDVPQVACFDTAFHRSQHPLEQRFALPAKVTELGVQRYGFHGLSYEYIADSLPAHLGADADGRVIVAHLGNGASLCAMHQRRSVSTSMGFSTIDGLVMGTRCGSLDPGVLLYLLEFGGYDLAALNKLLYKESGLLGVSGLSQDMRTLLASDLPAAQDAVAMFCHRIVREIGAMTAVLGGLDALVFTGGIGEHAAAIRSRVCASLDWLGLQLDETANTAGMQRISSPWSRIQVLALPTNEEWIIARHTQHYLMTTAPGAANTDLASSPD